MCIDVPTTSETDALPKLSARKRKAVACTEPEDEASNSEDTLWKRTKLGSAMESISPEKMVKGRKKASGKAEVEDKRLKRYRKHAPKSYLDVKNRALTQRLTVLERTRCGTDEAPEEKVVMAGSTGNVYTQHIGLIPSCNCPHAQKGNQCKHIIYVMLRILKAPEHIAYQLALTPSELREAFKNAAPIPDADGSAEATSSDGNRKPIEGECPICYMEFEPKKEKIVYCQAACGNNVHKDCMAAWVTAKHGKATCPYCRSTWDVMMESPGRVNLDGATSTEEGYINIAGQLGLSGQRDYSTYHSFWVQKQQRNGFFRG